MAPFDLSRRLAAEALGTALLVATVVGSGIMAETLTRDVALALLGNTLPTGAILVVLITILGPISGAHFNPAVTLIFALKRELEFARGAVLCRRANRGRHRRDDAGARDVRAPARRRLAQDAHRRRAMAGRSGCRLRPGRDHSRRDQIQPSCGALAGRALHHGGLLVHRVDVVCQSRSRHRAVAHQHFFRHPPDRSSRLHRRRARRRVRRADADGLVAAGRRGVGVAKEAQP